MKKILSYLKEYKKETFLGPLFKLFEAGLELLIPLIVSSIIDKGIKQEIPNKEYILTMFFIMIGCSFVGFLFAIIAQYFSAKAACGLSSELRKQLFNKIQSLSYREFDEVGTSSLITRMTSDVNQVQVGVNLTLRLFLRSPIIVFGAMIMAFTISSKIALIFVGVIILLLIVVLGIMAICIPLYQKAQKKLDKLTLATRENLVGSRVIRAFGQEDDEIAAYQEKNQSLTKEQKLIGRVSSLMNPLTFALINIAIILLIYFSAIEVKNDVLTSGNVVALYNYLSLILVELIKLANLIITINKAIASGRRIEEVLNLESSLKVEPSDEIKPHQHYLEFHHVQLKYHQKAKSALEDISFNVDQGDTIGIIGGTGSGKTSLVNLIPHFYDVTAGEILLEGKNINQYDVTTLRNRIGIVPQKAVLFKGTIASNLAWRKLDASEEEMLEAIKLAQGEEIIQNKEDGLQSSVSQNGANFSGGQKQRLCIARALINHPEILIFDDSSSALDYSTDAKLRKSLASLPYHPTIFLVSQRTSSIQHATKIIVLDHGQMVDIGTHEELLTRCEAYQEIYYSQIKKEAN
jgi:ABC-type multidrug transport system fused ATPase/permease subunit